MSRGVPAGWGGAALVLLLLLAVPAAGAEGLLAASSGGAEGGPAELFAIRVVRDEATGTITAEGAVELTYGDLRLQADRMVLTGEEMLTASGNVRFSRGDEYLAGEEMTFSLADETGVVTAARGFIAEFFVTGKEIRKTGEKEYRIVTGTVTACEQEVPDWKFASPDARVVVEDYVYAWHPTVWVKKVPVLYLPYLVAPIKTERATGLLVPSVGWDGGGISYSQDFFWVIAENADATVGVDLYQSRGARLRLEFRHILSPGTSGTASGSWIDDREDRAERWRVSLDQKLDLGGGVNATAKVDVVSDSDYATSYGESLEDRTAQDYDVSVAVRKRWGNLTATALVDIDKNVADDYYLGRLPELNLDLGRTRILREGPALEGRILSVTRFASHDEALPAEQTRALIRPKLTWPIRPGPWMTVTPSFTWHQAWYEEGPDGDGLTRSSPEAALTVEGPSLYRIFEHSDRTSRTRHLVEPAITYRYRGKTEGTSPYRYDAEDASTAANGLELSLVNRISRRTGEDPARDVVRLEVRQGYDFLLRDDGDEATDPLGRLAITMETRPAGPLTVKGEAKYDHADGRFPERSLSVGYTAAGGSSATMDLRYVDPDLAYLGVGASLALGRGWGVRFDGRYDLDAMKRVENRIGLDYKAQCWAVHATWTDREDSSVFRFSIDLKNLGTVLTF